MRKVLVTGSAGFVGRHVVEWVLSTGIADVTEIDLKNGDDCRDFFARPTPMHYDLVVHCAATVGGREGIDFNAALLGANNFQLDGAMFEWALNNKPGRIVYFSSAAAYPTWIQNDPTNDAKMNEGLIDLETFGAETPDESYGWAKLMGEMTATRVRRAGVPVTVVRPFSSYDYDQDDCYPFPEFVHRAVRGDSPFDVWGDGSQTRDFIHVSDLVEAIFALVDAEVDGPINLGTGVATSVDDLARIAMAAAGYEAPIRHLTEKPMGVRYRVSDNSRLTEFYVPQITVEEGMRRAVEAVRAVA